MDAAAYEWVYPYVVLAVISGGLFVVNTLVIGAASIAGVRYFVNEPSRGLWLGVLLLSGTAGCLATIVELGVVALVLAAIAFVLTMIMVGLVLAMCGAAT